VLFLLFGLDVPFQPCYCLNRQVNNLDCEGNQVTDIQRLNQYRLDEDLSYRQLAERVGIPSRTLFTLLTQESVQPYDRTALKIRRFLDSLQEGAVAS
jgi:hypothetical protein